MPTVQPGLHRVFLGYETYPTSAIAEFLLSTSARGNLAGHRVVLPGSGARRSLLYELVTAATARSVPLSPPRFLTPGQLAAELCRTAPGAASIAGPSARLMAWSQAVLQADDSLRDALRLDTFVSSTDAGRWVLNLHDRITSGCLSFAAARSLLERDHATLDAEQWRALSELEGTYRRVLSRWGVADANLEAIDSMASQAPVPHHPGPVVLACTLGLSTLQMRILEATSKQAPITVLIAAPDELHSHFDHLGQPIPEQWPGALPGAESLRTIYVDSGDEQAEAAFDALAHYSSHTSADRVAIVAADPALVPKVVRAADRVAHVRVRPASGTPGDQGPLPTLLRRLLEFIRSENFEDFLEFVRHPYVTRYIDTAIGDQRWLSTLLRYQESHAPRRVPWKRWPSASPTITALLRRLDGEVHSLTAHLRGGSGTVAEISDSIRSFLQSMTDVEGTIAAFNSVDESAADAIAATLDELTLQCPVAPSTPADVLGVLLHALRSVAAPLPADPSAIPVIGPLEVLHCPADTVLFLGMNDGVMPSSPPPHPLLPPPVLRRLGLESTEARHARDAAMLASILGGRTHVVAIAGRSSDEGDPLFPSRLLLQREPHSIADAFIEFSQGTGTLPSRAQRVHTPGHDTQHLATGPALSTTPSPYQPPDRLSVTSFKTYLMSPYLFYLRHVLKLSEPADARHELPPTAFGSLIHAVLHRFAELGGGDDDDPTHIAQTVDRAFQDVVNARFPSTQNPAVSVQLHMLRHRLDGFAEAQSRWAGLGWRIAHAEWSPPDQDMPVMRGSEERSIRLSGQIDRIDFNERTGEAALLDYKTGHAIDTPEKAHTARGTWIDLQLPLYRRLAESVIAARPVKLGYFSLPKLDAGQPHPGPSIAGWTESDLVDADRVAQDVVDRITVSDPSFPVGVDHPPRGVLAHLAGLGALEIDAPDTEAAE